MITLFFIFTSTCEVLQNVLSHGDTSIKYFLETVVVVYMMNFETLIVTIINLHTCILPNNNISPNSIRKLTKGSSLGAVGMF